MAIFATILSIHQSIYEATDGWLGHRLLGVPTLLLRTTGRRSGQTRTSALVYIEQNGSMVVVASKGGDPKPPAWLLNLEANPQVEYQIGTDRFAATAQVLEQGHPDYDALWQEHNRHNGGRYDEYQSKTERPIPLVRLTPSQTAGNPD